MHIHILGICGTFMGGLACLAQQQGHRVTGSDVHVYPPMSDQLREQGIELMTGYEVKHLQPAPDCVVIGNALSRGNLAVEYVLREGLPYESGPQWLAHHILKDRWVVAVAGTHGKTTTSSMVAWILDYAQLAPGFLIGGVPQDFGVSARLGNTPFFVIEADEYDSAFFDKRSKFVHYHPRTLVLNNLEFDHADIFPNIKAIQTQCHHLVRTVPDNGLIVHPVEDVNLAYVMAQGCWTPCETLGLTGSGQWSLKDSAIDGSGFTVLLEGEEQGRVTWSLLGEHNQLNGLAAIAAARHVGVPPAVSIEALNVFSNVKRRLEICGTVNNITIYDDFAHHPTAIATTLAGLRNKVGKARIIAILQMGSYTMSHGVHGHRLPEALHAADRVLLMDPASRQCNIAELTHIMGQKCTVFDSVEAIVAHVVDVAKPHDHILVMSNKGFGGIHRKLLEALS
ncbi:MAG: UDP-N-acetylmuramate:L-alanyl-gamma-D-glutamyl-meso-diaminopimelate ligase [Gammaproteobacteria bacterium]